MPKQNKTTDTKLTKLVNKHLSDGVPFLCGTHTRTRICKASILNLLAIAMDRYWAVTNVDYIYRRTRSRVTVMIVCAWTVGAVVSLAPIFGWKDPDFAYRVLVEHKCMVSQDVGYQIFATISTFYAPLVLLLALYWRIFQVSSVGFFTLLARSRR